MTSVADEAREHAKSTFESSWTIEDWERVPTVDDDAVGLNNKGVRFDAVVLYADLADSTGLVKNHGEQFAAEVYKTYVYAAAKAIRYHQGAVTAYDGDRVMGVFVGADAANDAVNAAARLTAVLKNVLQPELNAMYSWTDYEFKHKVGIDASSILVANTGIRGNNDYTWVGPAANNAAKMAALQIGASTYVTAVIYNALDASNLYAADSGDLMWVDFGTDHLGYQIYASTLYCTNA